MSTFSEKPSLKIRTASAIFWIYLRDYGLKNIFLGIKLFAFQDRKLKLSASVYKKISWNLTKFQLIQTIVVFIFSIGCLIESVRFPKKIFFRLLSIQNKKAMFTDPIFSEGFVENL